MSDPDGSAEDDGGSDSGNGGRGRRALLSRANRRRFLRTLVNVGVGAGVARSLAPRGFLRGGTDDTSIVYGLARGAEPSAVEPRRKQVPSEWYQELERAFEVRQSLARLGLPSLIGAFVVPGNYDDPAASLSLDVTDESALADIVETAGDVAYTANVVDVPTPGWDVEDAGTTRRVAGDLEDGRVPGGVLCGSGEFVGTLAPAMYDADGDDRFFATANHVFGGGGAFRTEHRGAPLYLPQPDGRSIIGRVRRGFPSDDIVRVDPSPGFSPESRIDGASPSRVVGQFTKVGLADLAARGEPLEKIGGRTGHTSGAIEGIDGITCYYGTVCKRGQLKWGSRSTMTDGDSGSVCYHPDPENPDRNLLVAGFNNARTWWPGGDFTWGTAAYRVRRALGIHF